MILAIMHDERVARALTIVWGVAPAFLVVKSNLQQMLSDVIKKGVNEKVLNKEGCYILTAGDPVGIPGTTNNIRILRAPEMNYFNDL
jgi:pyruvate kinase